MSNPSQENFKDKKTKKAKKIPMKTQKSNKK